MYQNIISTEKTYFLHISRLIILPGTPANLVKTTISIYGTNHKEMATSDGGLKH